MDSNFDLDRELNNLLALLRQLHAVDLVKEYYYGKHGNSAPHEVIQQQIDLLQKYLTEKGK